VVSFEYMTDDKDWHDKEYTAINLGDEGIERLSFVSLYLSWRKASYSYIISYVRVRKS
jgi:hypothetical protein